jgi:cytochrome c2
MPRRDLLILASGAVLVAAGIGGAVAKDRVDRAHAAKVQAARLTGGDADQGKAAIARYGCGGCHQIPGAPGATGQVGPPLAGVSARSYIAGRYANSPDNLVRWIRFPQTLDPGVAMPQMGVGERDARDIAAYLYTLK